MKNILQQQFKAPYNRTAFITNVLRPIFQGKVNEFTIFDDKGSQLIPLTESEKTIAKSIVKYGKLVTSDGRTIDLYEVIIHDNKIIERNKVSVGALIKKQIIGNNAIFVNFAYENPENKNWRFSFIAYDSVFEDGDIITVETNPKRYTYIFGEKEETYKTALDCFSKLADEFEIKIAKIKDAFGVEAMSKAFFDEYRSQYKNFVNQLLHSKHKVSAFNGDEKAIRDFVKKLLGRIVFLYFLQKKGWLGASSTNYRDGNKNFISNFFKEAKQGADFYPVWLSKLFFDTLNEKRTADNFTMPNGKVIKIPYLNGGLFERESTKYDFITFEPELFINLFEFFDQYNFTVYEDSPDDQTVAVDPEMLGHIFENLLEDNPLTGAFYTPKQIVQYMTQESLIEYLITHLPNTNKETLSAFVKDKTSELSKEELKNIDRLLDDVKICDPAIGSGAFPMGLLQEIFGLKEKISFILNNKKWEPAIVKENIIQNSIYGVDIEKGAVDIARLRFWLSLIVDEDLPKPLPNLDYKIIVGNSLLSRYKIENSIEEVFKDLNIRRKKNKLLPIELNDYKKAINNYTYVSDSKSKAEYKNLIKEIKEAFITSYSEVGKKSLANSRGNYENLLGVDIFGKAKGSKAQITKALKDFNTEINKRNEAEEGLLYSDAIEWRFEFPNILNEEGEFEGFDIVIGNPPYIKEYTNRNAFNGFRESNYYQGKMDLWYGFACLMLDKLKPNGIECFIAQNNWITSAGASKLRHKILSETQIKSFVDFGNYKVFQSAGIQTMIYVVQKSDLNKIESYKMQYSVLLDDKISNKSLTDFLDFKTKDNYSQKYFFEIHTDLISGKPFTFNSNDDEVILNKISNASNYKFSEKEVANGIHPHYDFVSKKTSIESNGFFKNGEGIFGLSNEELLSLNLPENEKKIIKPYYTTENLKGYFSDNKNKLWLIYTDSSFKNIKKINEYPTLKRHLDRFEDVITSDNKPYGLHRAREERFFLGEKIIVQRKCPNKPIFTYTDFDSYVSATFYVIKANSINHKFLTALLNSRLIAFWLRNKGNMQGNNFQLDKAPLLNIPLMIPEKTIHFEILVDYLLFLNKLKTLLNEHVPNSHIIEAFEEVVDAMVFELYFPNEFKKADIEFSKYAERDFKSIDGLDSEQQKEVIHDTYQKLREKNNEIRNNIKLMKIELRDLLIPILSA